MSFQTLYRAKSFGPGADLWILPEGASSPLAKKVDWYLNFQIARAEMHEPRPLSPELKKIIVENDLGLQEQALPAGAPLMVAAEKYFPTGRIIELKSQSSLQTWVDRIQDIWLKLGRPKLRVFLPNELTPEEFQKIWKTPLAPSEELTLVPG